MTQIYLGDRVRQTGSYSSGTGTIAFTSTAPGCQSFALGIGANRLLTFTAQQGNEWATASGTYNVGTDTLGFLSILTKSAGWPANSFPAGDLDIFVSVPAQFTSILNTAQNLEPPGGQLLGNASTATKLQNPRTLSIIGDASGSASFDGSANATFTAALSASGVTAGTYSSVSVDMKGRVIGGFATAYAPLASPALTGTPTAPLAGGSATSQIANCQFVNSAVNSSTYAATLNRGRNYVHNPRFEVAQRGNLTITTLGYPVDRWVANANLDSFTAQPVAMGDADRSMLSDESAQNCLQIITTGSVSAAAYSQVFQYLENVRLLAGKTVLVSFYARANVGGTGIGVRMGQTFGSGGSPSASVSVAPQSITVSTSWTRYTMTFTLPSVAAKTFGTDGNANTLLAFAFSAAANQTAAFGIGVQTTTCYIYGVQVEQGSVITPLERTEYADELRRCQRYYQLADAHLLTNTSVVNEYLASNVTFAVPMRAVPTVALVGFMQPPTNLIYNPVYDYVTTRGCRSYSQGNAVGITAYDVTVSASAEMQ